MELSIPTIKSSRWKCCKPSSQKIFRRVPVVGVAIRNDFFQIIPTKNTHRAPLFVVALQISCELNSDHVRSRAKIIIGSLLYYGYRFFVFHCYCTSYETLVKVFSFLLIQYYYKCINRPYLTSKEMHKTNKIPHLVKIWSRTIALTLLTHTTPSVKTSRAIITLHTTIDHCN